MSMRCTHTRKHSVRKQERSKEKCRSPYSVWALFWVMEGHSYPPLLPPPPKKKVSGSNDWNQYSTSWGRKWNFPLGGARTTSGVLSPRQSREKHFSRYVSVSKDLCNVPHGLK